MSSHTHRLMSDHTTFELPESSERHSRDWTAHPLHPRSDYRSSRTRSAKPAWQLPSCATKVEAALGDLSRSFTIGID